MKNVEEAMRIIRNACESIGQTNHRDIILVLGNTGSGKSTLTQFIGNRASALTAKRVGSIHLINGDNARISAGISSHIASTYLIKRVIDHAKRVKIILLISHPSVQQGVNRGDFTQLLKHAVTLIKNIDTFAGSISLIVTKVNETDTVNGQLRHTPIHVIVSNVSEYLATVKRELQAQNIRPGQYLTERSRDLAVKLIDTFLTKSNGVYQRIGIFRQPTEEGPINVQNLMLESKSQMLGVIHNNLQFTVKTTNDFGYTISDAAKNQIHDMVDVLNKNFADMSRFQSDYLFFLNVEVDKFSSPNIFAMKYFEMLPNFIESIKQPCSPMKFYQLIMKKLAEYDMESLQDSFPEQLQIAEYFDFLQTFSGTTLRSDTFLWINQLRLVQEAAADIKIRLRNKINKIQVGTAIGAVGGLACTMAAALAAVPIGIVALPVGIAATVAGAKIGETLSKR